MTKKILYYIQLPPPYHGVSIVNKQVFESEIINRNLHKELVQINLSRSLNDLSRITIRKIFLQISLFCKILYKIIAFKPHFIYYSLPPTGFGFYKEIPIIFLVKAFGVKPIFHLHGKGIAEKVKTKIQKGIYNYCFSNSLIIHLSEGLYSNEFKDIKLSNSIFYAVANGIPVANVHEPRKRTSVIELLFLSNIQESKGIFLLLDAFLKLTKFFPEIKLNIIGGFRNSQSEMRFNEFVVNNKLKNKIIFWGPRFGREKHKLISKSDILVHPSFNDAFPLVILEAMQHGLAIIGSDQGAIPEIIKPEFGYVFPTGDEIKLLECIERMLSDKKKLELMQCAAKDEYNKYYTLEQFEFRMSNIYNHL